MRTDSPTVEERTATDHADETPQNLPPEQARGDKSLTGFQQNILTVLADHGGNAYGLAIKRDLETFYGEPVNHGRLYPNLDTLVEHDLVDKSQRDKRTNNYELTDRGYTVLRTLLDRLLLAADVPRDDAENVLDHLDSAGGDA